MVILSCKVPLPFCKAFALMVWCNLIVWNVDVLLFSICSIVEFGGLLELGCSAMPSPSWWLNYASIAARPPAQKIRLISYGSMNHVSDIKLKRTDTTLDLSQKAEKGMHPPRHRGAHANCLAMANEQIMGGHAQVASSSDDARAWRHLNRFLAVTSCQTDLAAACHRRRLLQQITSPPPSTASSQWAWSVHKGLEQGAY